MKNDSTSQKIWEAYNGATPGRKPATVAEANTYYTRQLEQFLDEFCERDARRPNDEYNLKRGYSAEVGRLAILKYIIRYGDHDLVVGGHDGVSTHEYKISVPKFLSGVSVYSRRQVWPLSSADEAYDREALIWGSDADDSDEQPAHRQGPPTFRSEDSWDQLLWHLMAAVTVSYKTIEAEQFTEKLATLIDQEFPDMEITVKLSGKGGRPTVLTAGSVMDAMADADEAATVNTTSVKFTA